MRPGSDRRAKQLTKDEARRRVLQGCQSNRDINFEITTYTMV